MRFLDVSRALVAVGLLAGVMAAQGAAPADPKQAGAISQEQIQKEGKSADERSALNLRTANDSALQASPSELAQQMRGLVKDQLAAGKSPDEVKAYFVSKYGEWILLSPKPKGFNLMVYLLPILMVTGGGVFIWVMVRKWSAPRPDDANRTPVGPA